jgi:phosphoserine phosphatase
MLRLFLIRHGETDFNVKGIVQGGGVDSDLNEKGKLQGKAFFEMYKDVSFQKLYCSRLKRTFQTIHHFESLGYKIEHSERVNEFNWGDLEGKPSSAETRDWFSKMTIAWEQGDLDVGIQNGETPNSAWERCAPFFEELRKNHTEGNVLVCSHGRTLRIILSELLGHGMKNMGMFHHDNTGVNILQFHPNGHIKVETLNDLTHLEKYDLTVTRVDYRK